MDPYSTDNLLKRHEVSWLNCITLLYCSSNTQYSQSRPDILQGTVSGVIKLIYTLLSNPNIQYGTLLVLQEFSYQKTGQLYTIKLKNYLNRFSVSIRYLGIPYLLGTNYYKDQARIDEFAIQLLLIIYRSYGCLGIYHFITYLLLCPELV